MSGVLKKEKYRKAIDRKCNFRAWFRFLKGLLYPLLKLMLPGCALGLENLPESGGYILSFNHRSMLDAPMAYSAIPIYWHFIAKEEFYNNAFFRWLFPRLGVVGVNRENIDLSTIRRVVGLLKGGEVLGIFPEGTRNRDASDESMLRVKHGAAMFAVRGGASVLPVYIYRRPRFFRRSYVYIGKPMDLASRVSGPLTAEKLSELAGEISAGMEEAKAYLCEIMREKRYGKEVRAEKKRMKLRRKELRSQEKRRRAEEKKLKAAQKKRLIEEKRAAKRGGGTENGG